MMRCSGGTRRVDQVHGTSTHPSILRILQNKKLLHFPPADTATRQTTTAMAAQWHLLQYPQRALLIQQKGKFPMQRGRSPSLYQPRTTRVCLLWNRGKCTFPGTCVFGHSCAVCEGRHQATDCPHIPTDSPFREPIHGNTRPPQPGMANHT